MLSAVFGHLKDNRLFGINPAVTCYVGILDGKDGVWDVRIPDVPGCHGAGDTPEAALADAVSALREAAAQKAAKGVGLNPPRPVDVVVRDDAAEFKPAAGECLVLVPLSKRLLPVGTS